MEQVLVEKERGLSAPMENVLRENKGTENPAAPVVKEGEDFSSVSEIIQLSEYEAAIDFLLLNRNNKEQWYLKGLYRSGILTSLNELGYRKISYGPDVCKYIFEDQQGLITEVDEAAIRSHFYSIVKSTDKEWSFEIGKAKILLQPEKILEIFLIQQHLIFNKNFLSLLQENKKPILTDTKDAGFFKFLNGVVKVTSQGASHIPYSQLKEYCIWKDQIINRNFEFREDNDKSDFAQYVRNISNKDEARIMAVRTGIGHLIHHHGHPSKAKAGVGYDEEISDKGVHNGGTGKGLLAQAAAQVRTVTYIDGKKDHTSERFYFQGVTAQTQIIFIDDVAEDFSFERLFSPLSEGLTVEQKGKPSFKIPPHCCPKFYITSNSVLNGEGTSVERRQFIMEFSPHYSRLIRQGVSEPIVKEHGRLFFDNDQWELEEWQRFYSYMMECCHLYLKNGLTKYEVVSVPLNKLIKKTSSDFSDWIATKVEENVIKVDTDIAIKPLYEEFKATFYGEQSDYKQRTFTTWLKLFGTIRKWKSTVKRSNGIQYIIYTSR